MSEYSRLKMELERAKLISSGAAISLGKSFAFRKRTNDSDTPVAVSVLGTEVFTNLTFKSGKFLPLDGGEAISYNGLEIDAVLMTVSQTKNIVTTQISGKSGTFKEYVNDSDYSIDVSGVIVSKNPNVYPSLDVETLTRLFSVPDTLEIHSEFLDHFGTIEPNFNTTESYEESTTGGLSGITQVVVTDFNFPQLEGFRDQQPFTCKFISDTPIELVV